MNKLVLFDETGLNKETIHTLRVMIWAVAFGTVCFNITGGIAMTGYLKTLGVTDFVYGLIFAITPAATVVQIFGSYLLERIRKRKAIFLIAGFIQRLVWLPFGLVPFFVPMTAPTLRIWLVALFLLINSVSGPFVNVTFFSFLADISPIRIRGRYLSNRQRIATVMGILGGFMTAWLLDLFPGFNGYALVFALAAIFGTIDIAMFVTVKFPPMPIAEKKESIGKMLSEVVRNNQFIRIVGFVAIWAFSLNLSAQFYLVYIRTTLGLSNTIITLVAQILPSTCAVLMLSRWGRMMDKSGTRSVMLKTGRLSSLAPLLWVFVTPGPYSIVLIMLTYISGGLLLPGMDIGAQNTFLNKAPERNRSMYVAIYFCVTSLFGIALANTVGGWLLDNALPNIERMGFSLFGVYFNRYNYLFLITFLLRIFNAFVLLPRMVAKE